MFATALSCDRCSPFLFSTFAERLDLHRSNLDKDSSHRHVYDSGKGSQRNLKFFLAHRIRQGGIGLPAFRERRPREQEWIPRAGH